MMKPSNQFILLLFLLGSLFSAPLFGEGTKELMPDSATNKRAYILVANGTVGGNYRDPFALYNGDTNYRLFIHISDHVKEKIYFGVGASTSGGAVNLRVHRPDGVVVWSGTTPNVVGQQGYIRYYQQAYLGPTKLSPSGYPALIVDPTENGNYFITFQVGNGQSRSYEKVDISVIDTTTVTYKKGRVYCKAWQLNTNDPTPPGAHGFFGNMFVYSQDSIVTRFNPNGFDGRWFTISCNNSGCYPVGPSMPATEARKSTNDWHNYPSYKIFLNDPDNLVYPSGIIGQVVIPPPPGSIVVVNSDCATGNMDFTFEVTSSGTVTLTLQLSTLGSGFVDKEVLQTVTVGQNTMVWDGYDASVPPKLVPSGSTFPFTLTYVKGMTHLPLWDVENNEFGFLVNLIRPASTSEPSFYWDDTNISPAMPPGPTTSPPGGCQSEVTPCHLWYVPNGEPGNNKTINTWWYVSNTTTVPVTITKKQLPGVLGSITGPSGVCQGSSAQYTCPSDSNSQKYIWTWPGGTDTTSSPFKIITFSPTAPPGPGQITVKGWNAECGEGPFTTKAVTINQIPSVTTSPLVKTICNGTSANITLTANVTGSTFAWRAWSTNPNLGGYFNSSGSVISQTLTNAGTTTDSVRYRIAATAAGCLGDSVTYRVAVRPVPDLSNTPKNKQQCNNLNTNISLTSTVAGTQFTWTCTPSSPQVTGWSDNPTPTTLLDQTLVNSGYQIEQVIYHITPQANGCSGAVTDYIVTVYPTPNLSNSPAEKEICQGQSTGINLTSNVLGTTFTWTCTQTSGNISGYLPNAGPGTVFIDQTLTLTGVVKDSVIYHLTPRANNCDGVVADYKVVVQPVPQLNMPAMSDSICSEATSNILLTSTVAATTFTWTTAAGTGTVTGFSDGTGSTITQQLTNPLNTAGSVLYTITPATGSCIGNNGVFTQWVKPLPHLTNQPKGDSICSNTGPNIGLTSDVSNTWFTWTAVGSSLFVSGFSDQPTPTTLLDQTLTNAGFDIEWATYQVTPSAAGCLGPDSTYIVAVFPVPDMSNDPPSMAICSGQSTGVTLASHVTGTQFTWNAVGSSLFVSGFSDQPIPTTVLDQTLVNSGDDIETVTYTITPSANDCDGIDTSFVVTVYPVPDLSTTPLAKEICNNNSTNILLTSNVTGTLFTWTAIGSSLFVTGFSDNTTNPMTLIDQNLVNSGSVNETVTYRIVPHANGCLGDTVDYVVTIVPSPYLTNNPLTQSQCNNLSTALTMESNVAGTQFTWTATGSSGNVSGYSNSVTPGTLIDQTLVNSGFNTETVTYHVTPVNSGCPGSVTDYTVTVFPVQDVFFVPNGEVMCEGNVSNLSIQSHVTGATFSWTATPSSPDLSGYSDGSGELIAQTIDNAGSTIETVTYLATPSANGCPPGTSMPVILTVNPRPAVSAAPSGQAICNGASTGLSLMADVAGTTFAWRAFSSSMNVTGYSNGTGALISQALTNSGYTIDIVTYRVAGTANGCTGDSSDFHVVVYPVADVLFTPSTLSVCSGQWAVISITSNVSSTSFSWTATGSSGNVSGYTNGSGDLIQQTLFNAGFMMPTVTYMVTPVANGCTGTQNSAVVTVNPLPVVSLGICFDTLTTTQAKPFLLKGAIPAGGVFSGPGGGSVPWLTGSTFYPALADTGRHHIRYTYTNSFGCIDSASITIHIADPVSHICGDTLTDIRDNNRYLTVLIGSQCWMANNLNFGSTIASTQIQRDNCISEKYCFNNNPANCTAYGGLYQWDEAMRYTADAAAQGLCPPGWHIPTEGEWNILFSAFVSNGFAGNALKTGGYSGFNALMTGIRFQNREWKFAANDPILRSKLYWTSDRHAPGKSWAHGMNEVVDDPEYTPSVSLYPAQWDNTFAVRCLKD